MVDPMLVFDIEAGLSDLIKRREERFWPERFTVPMGASTKDVQEVLDALVGIGKLRRRIYVYCENAHDPLYETTSPPELIPWKELRCPDCDPPRAFGEPEFQIDYIPTDAWRAWLLKKRETDPKSGPPQNRA